MSATKNHIRTPMARVRGFGAAGSGTWHFWHQRVTSVALVLLTIVFVVILLNLLGRNHAAVVQILGSPVVAILMLLFVGTGVYHMWLGMQEILLDYVHDEKLKFVSLIANTFFCFMVGVSSVFAILKLSFGV
ncbi:MAG: succinate dehydrogenase, hydrophobic membrane anchor protein [Xanthobacteraceae bacterium]|jgi:succinate dehydrogenase / fumarate reductase membrane anchor subunit|uniref:succinate dehydrogenase, hydrophobic membrane anchor protein n=1 Tax=Pseudolabrys sp. TaxID=1960880 RepID=UPI003D0B412F